MTEQIEQTQIAEVQPPRQGPALAAIPPKAGGKIEAIIPRSFEELKYVAGIIVHCGLAPDSYDGDPSKIAIGIMKGLEVGLPPLTALSNIAIINKRPSIWGDGAVALIQNAGLLEKMERRELGSNPGASDQPEKYPDDYGVEVLMWRKGQSEPYVGRFTVGDAKRARLWMNPKKAPWMLYPERMLFNRARAFPLRDGFADCLSGLHIREEVEDLPAAPQQVEASFLDDAPALEHKPATPEAA